MATLINRSEFSLSIDWVTNRILNMESKWKFHNLFSAGDVYRLAYEEVDESEVKIYGFPSYLHNNGEVEEFR